MNYRENKTNVLHKGPKSHLHQVHQDYFLQKISHAESEVWFPKISQRADIYVPKLKVVFEIQISKISLQEIIQRSNGYAAVGMRVIWIFPLIGFGYHSLKERYYLSTINEQGEGEILDVVDTNRYLVDVSRCYPDIEGDKGVYFKGDTTDRALHGIVQKKLFFKRWLKWLQKRV